MTVSSEKTEETNLPPDAYPKAMNLIGQNLLGTLAESMQSLPSALRTNEVAMQGLAAFLANVLHQQAPQNSAARQQMFEGLSKLIHAHIAGH